MRVKGLWPGAVEPLPQAFASVNGTLFFLGSDCTDPRFRALWKSDGTEAGTVRLTDLAPGVAGGLAPASSLLPLESQDAVLFAGDDGKSGAELWMSGELPGQLVQVADIAPRAEGSSPRSLTLSGEHIYFLADDSRSRLELWSLGLSQLPGMNSTCHNP